MSVVARNVAAKGEASESMTEVVRMNKVVVGVPCVERRVVGQLKDHHTACVATVGRTEQQEVVDIAGSRKLIYTALRQQSRAPDHDREA
jgi:hypothetical protein